MKFRNSEEPFYPQGVRELLKWQLGPRREAPRRVRVPTAVPDGALIASDAPSLTWVGHATFLARLGGRSVLFDPVWSTSLGPGLRRNVAPGLPLEDAAPDVVLVSHNHRDHLDAPTIERIGDRAHYVVPSGLGPFMRKRGGTRVTELGWWESVELDGGVTVHLVPSQHWSQRGAFDRNDTLWGGFVVDGGGRRVYHSGDTSWFGGFAEIGRRFSGIDAAMLPIGAYDPEWFMRRQHMNPDDAMRAFLALGARRFVAMHWGTFKLTDEPLDEPPQLLEQARLREALPRDRVLVPAIGETIPL